MNPLIRQEGICDPHIHIFNGKAYLYATCDNNVPHKEGFEMTKWKIFSSEDLIHWTLEDTEYPGSFYCGPIDQCWAVDAAEKDGKYYWYYSNRFYAVGVGISDQPGGPFREALGHPLVSEDTPPAGVKKWDPCVFVDDDGSAYLIAGSCFPRNQTLSEGEGRDQYVMAKLNEDMVSLAEPLRSVPYFGNLNGEDKVTVHKENGRYYLSHSSFYAVADNVYGPYYERGNTLSNIDHGCFFTYRGQTYQATGGMDNPNRCFRASFLCYCHYRENGDIVIDQAPMAYGVGQYDGSWEKIEAEWFFDCRNAQKRERPGGGFEMAVEEGGWLAFPNVCHLAENTRFDISCRSEGGVLEIRGDAPDGPLLGRLTLNAEKESCVLSNPEGHRDMYLVLAQGSAAIDFFRFGSDCHRSSAEAARSLPLGSGKMVDVSGAAADRALSLEAPGDGAAVLLDGGPGGVVQIFVRCCGQEGARLSVNPASGPKAELVVPDTHGQWQSFPLRLVLQPGVNRVEVTLENGKVILDSLRTEQTPSVYKSFPAANGRIYPFGNGCWDGLAQPQWSREAYSGRMVSGLWSPGFRVSVHMDGGAGGRMGLQFRCHADTLADARIEINGGLGGTVTFEPGKSSLTTPVELRPGDNEITLVILTENKPGLALDAFSLVPLPADG